MRTDKEKHNWNQDIADYLGIELRSGDHNNEKIGGAQKSDRIQFVAAVPNQPESQPKQCDFCADDDTGANAEQCRIDETQRQIEKCGRKNNDCEQRSLGFLLLA